MKYRVELTRRAERDIEGILAWIERQSPRGAKSWLRRLDQVVSHLETSAAAASLAPESGYGDTEIRQVVFKTRLGKPYRILFTIQGKSVFIRHVRGPGQDLVSPDEIGPSGE